MKMVRLLKRFWISRKTLKTRFYECLYSYRAVEHTIEEILDGIEQDFKTILYTRRNPISMDDINVCFKATRNNISLMVFF